MTPGELEEPGTPYRSDMKDLAFGLCALSFIIVAIAWIVTAMRKRHATDTRPVAEVIDVAVITEPKETTTLARNVRHVDPAGRTVCRFCAGYSPTWYRPRTLVMREGIVGLLRSRERVPPAWQVVTQDDEAQNVCAGCRVLETQALAKELEDRLQMYEETTTKVVARHQAFVEGFHDQLREQVSGRRGWKGNVSTW